MNEKDIEILVGAIVISSAIAVLICIVCKFWCKRRAISKLKRKFEQQSREIKHENYVSDMNDVVAEDVGFCEVKSGFGYIEPLREKYRDVLDHTDFVNIDGQTFELTNEDLINLLERDLKDLGFIQFYSS